MIIYLIGRALSLLKYSLWAFFILIVPDSITLYICFLNSLLYFKFMISWISLFLISSSFFGFRFKIAFMLSFLYAFLKALKKSIDNSISPSKFFI